MVVNRKMLTKRHKMPYSKHQISYVIIIMNRQFNGGVEMSAE